MIHINKNTIEEFIRFAVIGCVSTAVNYLIFFVLFSKVDINYLISSAIGFIVGIFVSYSLNRKFTFTPTSNNRSKELLGYFCVCFVSLVFSILTLKTSVTVFQINPLIGNVIAVGVSTITNFVGIKLFVFKGNKGLEHKDSISPSASKE